ncbi:MAG: hypothetical protein U0935_06720 [Pirellulales bacterium]
MMAFKSALCAALLLTVFVAAPSANAVDDVSSKKGSAPTAMDIRAILEKGVSSNSLPEDMEVHIGACLGELDKETAGEGVPDHLLENWEFTPKQVRRVMLEDNNGKRTIESRPFDSKELCKDLLEGKAIEIQAREGQGPQVAFAGSRYRRGTRTIRVLWKGQTILDLYETNGPVLDLYAETDARAFGALYDRLARQARLAFRAQEEKAK